MRKTLSIVFTIVIAVPLLAQQPVEAWNSVGDDYAPSWNRKQGGWYVTRATAGKSILMRAQDSDSKPAAVQVLRAPSGLSVGCFTTTLDGEAYAVVYRMGNRQNYATIVRVITEGNGLSLGDPIEQMSGDWFTSYPAISPEGDRMVMVSDRPGGAGGTDIWMLDKLLDGTWSQPQHTGQTVNSLANETSPFLISTDTLMFSSNGFGGIGGMDVFMSVYQAGRWGDPVPVDKLNSPFDDTDAVVGPRGEILFCRPDQVNKGADVWKLPVLPKPQLNE